MFNPRTFSIADTITKRAKIEGELFCQLYSDPEEKNHLDFTETPPIPKVAKVERIPLSVGALNLVKQFLP